MLLRMIFCSLPSWVVLHLLITALMRISLTQSRGSGMDQSVTVVNIRNLLFSYIQSMHVGSPNRPWPLHVLAQQPRDRHNTSIPRVPGQASQASQAISSYLTAYYTNISDIGVNLISYLYENGGLQVPIMRPSLFGVRSCSHE